MHKGNKKELNCSSRKILHEVSFKTCFKFQLHFAGYNPTAHVRGQRTIEPMDNKLRRFRVVFSNLELNGNANPYSASLVEAEGFMGPTWE